MTFRHVPIALAVVGSATLSACGGSTDAAVESIGVPDGYELVFDDDFDGDTLEATWSTCFWWQLDGGCTIASNDEQQWYRPDAVTLRDGVVELTASASPQTTDDGSVLPYRSGMISSGHVDNDAAEPGFAFTYGYVEARVRFPGGDGSWPAVWLLSADRTSRPEIDLMEWYGSRPDLVTAHVHHLVDGERVKQRIEHRVESAAGAWHHVAARWTDDRVEFFFDGELMGVVDDPSLVPTTPMYLIVNLALGGPAGEVRADALPQSFGIDWVRVWQEAS